MMAQIREDKTFVQIVQYETEPSGQAALIKAIASEIERWVCQLPGFEAVTLHASDDGRHVLNYVQWSSEATYSSYTQNTECAKLRTAIQNAAPVVGPHAMAYRVVRCINWPWPYDDGERTK